MGTDNATDFDHLDNMIEMIKLPRLYTVTGGLLQCRES